MLSNRHLLGLRRILLAVVAAGLAVLPVSVVVGPDAGQAAASPSYVPIVGEGSTWSANAIDQWIQDVHQYGMRVSYTGNGSTSGREAFLDGTTDFAGSDIPFQTVSDDGSAAENPTAGTYAYVPIVAGGTTFMYNLDINGKRVTNLRLSGETIAKIFTGVITNWDDPAIAAEDPGLTMPNRTIVPVVRSDGSGSTAQFVLWMINQYPSLWSAYCSRSGRAPACGETSFYPTIPGMVAQSGDLGVAGYVSQGFAQGAIGYVNYSYALNAGFPVAQMLNSAGYYTQPTPDNVAVSLLKAQVNTSNPNDTATYLTQDLTQVYTDTDPRAYPLSSYSYVIIPITTQGQFTASKGTTLGAFLDYAMCQGQQQSASLGYSPMPINLVEDTFTQINRIPGTVKQSYSISQCNNPTFSPNGTNLLADNAPQPPACDKAGPTQCSTGTGGDTAVTPVKTSATVPSSGGKTSTPSSGGGSSGGTNGGSSGGSTAGGSTSSGGDSGTGAGASSGPATGATGSSSGGSTAGSSGSSATTVCNPDAGSCSSGASAGADGSSTQEAVDATSVLPAASGWTATQTLMLLAGLIFVTLIVAPAVVWRRLSSKGGR